MVHDQNPLRTGFLFTTLRRDGRVFRSRKALFVANAGERWRALRLRASTCAGRPRSLPKRAPPMIDEYLVLAVGGPVVAEGTQPSCRLEELRVNETALEATAAMCASTAQGRR